MFSFKKFTTPLGFLAALMVSSAVSAAPIPHASFSVTGGYALPTGANPGNNNFTVTNGGAVVVSSPDPYSLAAFVFLGEAGTLRALPSISGFTPVLNYLTLTSGITADLLSLMVNGFSGGPPGFLNISGDVVLHAPGFDATNGVVSLTGTANDNVTFSFAVEANANMVPEPLSMPLLGAGLLGMGAIYRRRSPKNTA